MRTGEPVTGFRKYRVFTFGSQPHSTRRPDGGQPGSPNVAGSEFLQCFRRLVRSRLPIERLHPSHLMMRPTVLTERHKCCVSFECCSGAGGGSGRRPQSHSSPTTALEGNATFVTFGGHGWSHHEMRRMEPCDWQTTSHQTSKALQKLGTCDVW